MQISDSEQLQCQKVDSIVMRATKIIVVKSFSLAKATFRHPGMKRGSLLLLDNALGRSLEIRVSVADIVFYDPHEF